MPILTMGYFFLEEQQARGGEEKQFKYANSFTDAVSVKMKGKYMVGIPIERVELSAGKVVNASKTEYKDTLNMILPKRTLKFSSTTPKTLADYAGAYVQDIGLASTLQEAGCWVIYATICR